jgi:hypothetical protein
MRSNQADKALIQYEAGQTLVDMQQMTDSGDHTTFSIDDVPFSNKSGFEPDIRPDGLLTGGVISASTSNDKIAITDLTCYIGGVLVTVTSISEQDVERSEEYTPGETYIINSVTVTSGGAIAILQGNEGASFSTTRGADGGPPLIPTTSIEIGWVRLSSTTPATVETSEILQIPGSSKEVSSFPVYDIDYAAGEVTFIDDLPLIHTGSVPKGVYCEVYTPIFASADPASDFVPAMNSHSQTSTQVYNGTIGASSSSLGQASFSVYLKDGITDHILSLADETIWVKFFANRLRSPYSLTNGKLGISLSYPPGDNIQGSCTLTPTQKTEFYEE